MKKTSLNPNEHIASLPDEVRADIEKIDQGISSMFDASSRVLWQGKFWGGSDQNIMGYGDFTYKRPGNDVDWFVAGLAVQKNHISIYLNGVEDKQYVAEKYGPALGKVKVGKSSISFKSLDDIDYDKLMDLVAKSKELMV